MSGFATTRNTICKNDLRTVTFPSVKISASEEVGCYLPIYGFSVPWNAVVWENDQQRGEYGSCELYS